MGSVRPLRMDAELFGEELNRGAHPEALMRSNRIVHCLCFPSRFLHIRQIGCSVITLPPFLAECPVQPLDLPIQLRAMRRQDPQRNPLCLASPLELRHEL